MLEEFTTVRSLRIVCQIDRHARKRFPTTRERERDVYVFIRPTRPRIINRG